MAAFRTNHRQARGMSERYAFAVRVRGGQGCFRLEPNANGKPRGNKPARRV
jgi:hypothetical protein